MFKYMIMSLSEVFIICTVPDVDECAADTQKTLCPTANNVVCNNTVGSYVCTCANPTYFKKESDKKCVGKSSSGKITEKSLNLLLLFLRKF